MEEIENLIHTYFEGIFYGNTQQLKRCFSENAFIYGAINTCEYIKSAPEYMEIVRSRKSPNDLSESLKMSIIGIEILGKIAVAKLHVPMLGFNYYDYISLFKIHDEWKIVNKIYTHVDTTTI